MPWANPILACSVFRVFPHSAGVRLCRMTRVRKGSGWCHRAVIRHIPEFGIVTQGMQARIRVRLDLFAQLRHLLFNPPGPERLGRILWAREHVLAVGLFDEPLE